MEILEAILKYFNIDKAKIDCLQAYFDNNKTLVLIVSSILTIILLRFLGKELLLILIPIAISSVIANFFRNKDKEEAQSIRDRDKEDTDARNLRAELREYFLTNCKPIINEKVKGLYQKRTKYVNLVNKKYTPKDMEKLQEHFICQLDLVYEIHAKFVLLPVFIKNISHKKYIKRFYSYVYIVQHILMLYDELISPQIMDSKVLYESETLNQKQKLEVLHFIIDLIQYIDLILAESELTLFNHNFDKDEIIFQNHMDFLDKAVLDTGLDPSEQFRCSREELEKILKSIKQ